MSKTKVSLKVYVVSDDKGYLRRLKKKLKRSGILIIEVLPESAFDKIRYVVDADMIVIDIKGVIDFRKNYYINALLNLFYRHKFVLMTNKYEENAFPKAIENQVYGYIYKSAKTSTIVTALFEIADGDRCYMRPVQWQPRFWSYFAYLRNTYLIKLHSKTETQ